MDDRLPSAVRGGGLYLRQGETVLKGFPYCDSSRVFVKADARILYGVRVLVWHDQINDPVSLTYGFPRLTRCQFIRIGWNTCIAF